MVSFVVNQLSHGGVYLNKLFNLITLARGLYYKGQKKMKTTTEKRYIIYCTLRTFFELYAHLSSFTLIYLVVVFMMCLIHIDVGELWPIAVVLGDEHWY